MKMNRIKECINCGSEDLYGPEVHYLAIICQNCGHRYELFPQQDQSKLPKMSKKDKKSTVKYFII